MKQETIRRIKRAGEYQKLAVRALFPEKMREHLDVIEGELRMMAMEMFVDFMKNCEKAGDCEKAEDCEKAGDCGEKQGGREGSRPGGAGVKKVDIL